MYDVLRKRLRQLDIDQTELARMLHANQTYVSRRLTGRVQWRLDEMYFLLDLCEAKPDELHIYFPRGGRPA